MTDHLVNVCVMWREGGREGVFHIPPREGGCFPYLTLDREGGQGGSVFSISHPRQGGREGGREDVFHIPP